MKLLFYILIFGLIVFLNVGLYLPSLLAVDEEDIGRNTKRLKKHQWFQDFLSNDKYKDLIVHDQDVRKVIGKFNDNRIEGKLFEGMYRRKLQSVLQKKSNGLA